MKYKIMVKMLFWVLVVACSGGTGGGVLAAGRVILAQQLWEDYGSAEKQAYPRKWKHLDQCMSGPDKCFSQVHLIVRYTNPKYLRNGKVPYYASTLFKPFVPFSAFPEHPEAAKKMLERIQYAVDVIHRHGCEVYLTFAQEGSDIFTERTTSICPPGAQADDFEKHPEFQAEILNPVTGKFIILKNFLDWGNSAAVEYHLKCLEDTLKMIRGIDYYQIHEESIGWYRGRKRSTWDRGMEHAKYGKWYKVPLFSRAALASYRKYTGDAHSLFPSPPGAVKTERTFITDRDEDWRKWRAWIENVYTDFTCRRIHAVMRANRGNPRFKGVIYFNAISWIREQYNGINLDRILANPHVPILQLEWMGHGDGLRRAETRDFIASAKRICRKHDKILGLWWYPGSPYTCYSLSQEHEVRRIRQYYTFSLFKRLLRAGAGRLEGWHVLESSPVLAMDGNGERVNHEFARLYAGSYYDPATTELLAVLKKKYSLGRQLNAAERKLLEHASVLPSLRERKKVIRIARRSKAVKIDGSLDDWNMRALVRINWKNLVNGAGVVENYRKARHYSAMFCFGYDERFLYFCGKVKDLTAHSLCPKAKTMDSMRIRINLEDPDHKSGGWLKRCKLITADFGNAEKKARISLGEIRVRFYDDFNRYHVEGRIPFDRLPGGCGYSPAEGKVISLGFTLVNRRLARAHRPDIYLSEGGISAIYGGGIGREELWGYAVFE